MTPQQSLVAGVFSVSTVLMLISWIVWTIKGNGHDVITKVAIALSVATAMIGIALQFTGITLLARVLTGFASFYFLFVALWIALQPRKGR